MGLLGKLSEARMKDPAEGVLRIVGISQPDPTASSMNYRLDGVVTADGLLPTAVTHHGMASVSRWPSPGDQLPVTVDRAKPERLVIHWEGIPAGAETAKAMSEQLAEQMRVGTAPTATATPPSVPTVSNADILARGTPGSAMLLGTFQSPVPASKEGRMAVGLTLNVTVAGHPPYQVQNVYAVPFDKTTALKVGSTLPVKADLTTPNLVAVDWDAVT